MFIESLILFNRKALSKFVADDILKLISSFLEKIRLGISCESSAKTDSSHKLTCLIFLLFFFLKNDIKIF